MNEDTIGVIGIVTLIPAVVIGIVISNKLGLIPNCESEDDYLEEIDLD